MLTLKVTLRPLSAFGGPLRGDTLFGQLCWAIRHRHGEECLRNLLKGYTLNQPFAVISDAFPTGYLPCPALPLHRYREVVEPDRKRIKKRKWLPVTCFNEPMVDWLNHAHSDIEVLTTSQGRKEIISAHLWAEQSQPHNTINRMTGATGTGEFAPYSMSQRWYATEQELDIYISHEADRLTKDEVITLLEDIGQTGYGRDASIGLGKFEVRSTDLTSWPSQENANIWLTLAPCATQGMAFDAIKCWYQPFTRFGRHGDLAVHSGRPFKTPVLLANTAALLSPKTFSSTTFTGQGLGGNGEMSRAVPETVHQGYAPVLAVHMEDQV